jgi:fructose-1,6-bisphosphatase/inositol monophosphatase family enzyme
MYDPLKRLAVAVGNSVHHAKQGLSRDGMENPRWKELLKDRCLQGIRSGLEANLDPDVAIQFVETPYNTKKSGRGQGKNEMSVQLWQRARPARAITVLADIVDGSWNAACGAPWSASTMVALTDLGVRAKRPEELVLADFKCGLIVPMVGATASPRQAAGFYYGSAGEPPRFREVESGIEHPLHTTDVQNVQHTRCFLDLFTAETYDALAISIDAVKPLMYDWGDIARFYGAGIELMSLLGMPGTTPGFGGYVAANQKADNLIPTTLMLEGAGVIVTSWWGERIDRMKIMERMYVAIGANPPLHEHLVRHLSKTARLP